MSEAAEAAGARRVKHHGRSWRGDRRERGEGGAWEEQERPGSWGRDGSGDGVLRPKIMKSGEAARAAVWSRRGGAARPPRCFACAPKANKPKLSPPCPTASALLHHTESFGAPLPSWPLISPPCPSCSRPAWTPARTSKVGPADAPLLRPVQNGRVMENSSERFALLNRLKCMSYNPCWWKLSTHQPEQ